MTTITSSLRRRSAAISRRAGSGKSLWRSSAGRARIKRRRPHPRRRSRCCCRGRCPIRMRLRRPSLSRRQAHCRSRLRHRRQRRNPPRRRHRNRPLNRASSRRRSAHFCRVKRSLTATPSPQTCGQTCRRYPLNIQAPWTGTIPPASATACTPYREPSSFTTARTSPRTTATASSLSRTVMSMRRGRATATGNTSS